MVDPTKEITKNVLQIISYGEKLSKPTIIIVNKIDLLKKEDISEINYKIRARLKSIRFVSLLFLSGLKNINIYSLKEKINEIIEESKKKISKKELNSLIKESFERKIKNSKLYFCLHQEGFLHKFILFTNKQSINFSEERYLKNIIRKSFKINNLPILIKLKSKEKISS